MIQREEIAQGEHVALEFKEARPKDSLKHIKTVGAFANGRGWRTVSYPPRRSRACAASGYSGDTPRQNKFRTAFARCGILMPVFYDLHVLSNKLRWREYGYLRT